MGQNERRFILAVDIPIKLNYADTLRSVHNQADRSQQVHKGHLARCKDSARCNAKLVVTVLALKLLARGDPVRLMVGTNGVNSLAICLRLAHLAERIIRSVFASFVDAAKAKCA